MTVLSSILLKRNVNKVSPVVFWLEILIPNYQYIATEKPNYARWDAFIIFNHQEMSINEVMDTTRIQQQKVIGKSITNNFCENIGIVDNFSRKYRH